MKGIEEGQRRKSSKREEGQEWRGQVKLQYLKSLFQEITVTMYEIK